ncbi:COMM domain-containing protein 3 [Episyrphus balteatus]|uniref:COMM domain-containing protein 3 n=1 Tax=Episyrphus balteatus TaxID=286459 RepID=UPI002485214D|nr:COMM domain-containing protein 3 [Episyrphus balteatus]
MALELSKLAIDGLKHLGSTINIEISKKLIASTVKLSLYADANVPPNPEIYASNADYAKQSEFAVATLLFLATKHGYDGTKLRHFLEQHSINQTIIDDLVKTYDTNRNEFLMRLLRTGHAFPHISDVEWKIVCDVKSAMSDCSSGELTFHVNLGNYREKTGERETIVEFICNTEELQSLINKLKEIERHCTKLSSGDSTQAK